MGIGQLRERVTVLTERPRSFAVSALTWAAGFAAAVTISPHGYVDGDFVTVAGAVPSGYNGKVVVAVTSTTGLRYPVAATLTTPATGAITATYAGDTHGGRAALAFRALMTVWAEYLPLKAFEKMQRNAVEDGLACRFRVRARVDLVAGLRAQWTPRWPIAAPVRTFRIRGVEPDGEQREYLLLECDQVTL